MIEIKYQSLSNYPDQTKKVVPISKTLKREKPLKFNISQLLLFKIEYHNTNQYPAYAVKSDNSKENISKHPTKDKNQYPAYALKSDDGNQTQILRKPQTTNILETAVTPAED